MPNSIHEPHSVLVAMTMVVKPSALVKMLAKGSSALPWSTARTDMQATVTHSIAVYAYGLQLRGFLWNMSSSNMKFESIKCDAPNDVLNYMKDQATQAVQQCHTEQEMASYVRKRMDDKYQSTWGCVVGQNFGSEVPYIPNSFAFFTLDKYSFLIYKASENAVIQP
ncbi:unnamed protein product [Schistocephalus solidus]|uniref:Dynein light chain n=1 Tax=Schistocephalus solidus TaxID=70667 RepID=A0A183SW92_SCHSO|nr:unnamed protein product [Schistocephalus solidus]